MNKAAVNISQCAIAMTYTEEVGQGCSVSQVIRGLHVHGLSRLLQGFQFIKLLEQKVTSILYVPFSEAGYSAEDKFRSVGFGGGGGGGGGRHLGLR